jgi:hypothetical protein
MAGIDEIASEQPGTASELENEPLSVANGGQVLQDPGGASVGVESEAEVVNER